MIFRNLLEIDASILFLRGALFLKKTQNINPLLHIGHYMCTYGQNFYFNPFSHEFRFS